MISYIFLLLGIIAISSALVVISALNPVYRTVYLILIYILGAFLMIILDYYFIGLTYIVVYVGAIAIIFLFVIMMVQLNSTPNVNIPTPKIIGNLTHKMITSPYINNLSNYISKSFFARLAIIFFLSFSLILFIYVTINGTTSYPSYYLFTNWSTIFHYMTDIQSLGVLIYVASPLAIVLIGLVLWVVLIGVILIS